ncbi:MAG TPA: hypothetical protein VFI00_06125, partial [Kribbella sp.]|nr:hypothetical protein [Kribbella sp.]
MSTLTESRPRAVRRTPSPGRPRRRITREAAAAWILALPFVVLFLAFTAGPVLGSLGMSFTDMRQRDLRTPFAVN